MKIALTGLLLAIGSLVLASDLLVWMCLEFCDESADQIEANLLQVKQHADLVSVVSFEKYTLGPNSTLVDNNLTLVSPQLLSIGVELWPLLSSYPHPPEFIDWMRSTFQNPDPFISSCVSEAKKFGYVGYNLDWEPTDGVTADDGVDYATFITTFADELHANGLKLSVDIATWSPIWNFALLSSTSADYFVSMGTYTSTDSSFTTQLNKLVDTFGVGRSSVGLETVNASTEDRLPLQEVVWRFEEIKNKGANRVALWKMPVPTGWWPIVRDFFG